MADLEFSVNLVWQGMGRNGAGNAALAKDVTVAYSAPDSMGGKGEGTSPEDADSGNLSVRPRCRREKRQAQRKQPLAPVGPV